MIESTSHICEWGYNTPLTAAQVVVIPIAMENNPVTVCKGSDVLFVTFAVQASAICTLVLQGDNEPGFPAALTLFTINVLAATYTTPYSLPPPVGQSGFVVVTQPFIRFQLTETSGGNQASTRFYAKAWA